MQAGRLMTLSYCYSGHALAHMFMLLFPTIVLGLSDVFDASYEALLPLATLGLVAFGAGAMPAGWLADRWSAKGMLTIFFIGTGAASIATGYAESKWQLGAGLTAIGCFASIYHPVGASMLVRYATKVGKVFGINAMAGNIGTAIAPAVAGGLMAWLDWRMAFIIPGIVSILMGIAFALTVKENDGHKPEKHNHEAENTTRVDKIRVFIFLIIVTLAAGLIYHILSISLPKLFEQRVDMFSGVFGIGLAVSIIYGISAFAQLLIGWLIDKWSLKKLYMLLFLIQTALLIIAIPLINEPLLIVMLALVFADMGTIPMGDAIIARYSSDKWRSTIFGLKFVLALGSSATAVPLVAITLKTDSDFNGLFVIMAILAAATTLATFMLPKTKKA